MNITLMMLFTKFLEKYPDVAPTRYPTKNTASVTGIRLLPDDLHGCEPGQLYLCHDLPPILLQQEALDYYVLCICEETFDVPDKENIIVFFTKIKMPDIFNALLNIYDSFIEWAKALDFALFREASMQEMVDLSEAMLGNPLLILDPALKLLAFTKNHVVEDDASFSFAVKNGYLSQESVRLFEDDHTFERIYMDTFLSSNADKARAYPDMIRGIKLNDGSIVYIVLLHNSPESKSYVTQIFENFTNSIAAVFKKQNASFHRERYVEDYFLIELLDNKDVPMETIKERLSYIRLPFQDYFLFCTIYSNIRQTTSEQYFIETLRNAMRDCHIFSYGVNISVLFFMPHSAVQNYMHYVTQRFQALETALRTYHAKICVSKPFFTLDKIHAAKEQTANCRRISLKEKSGSLYEFYEDYATSNLFLGNASSDLLYDFCNVALLQMYTSEDEKAKYQMRILETYLNHDRKMTDTAARLNMHRNNVIYHIQQIQENYHLQLDDPKVRLELLNSFALLHFLEL